MGTFPKNPQTPSDAASAGQFGVHLRSPSTLENGDSVFVLRNAPPGLCGRDSVGQKYTVPWMLLRL